MKTETGGLIGLLVGVHLLLAFTFLARPGRWLFAHMPVDQGILAYGYVSILWLGGTVLIGIGLARLFRRDA